ncbi:hypothetical protein GN958_ATG22920 [Phytophthora infestans]|uniref:Uncharacterized protein n=1 Tax=Phytophthora infestans TaxID=4787 RepID=A0A8S9TMQ4_PHYIN|nr:hypothetical protein GN958_ATG22920 [Phytophthora infestans]
MVSSDSDNDDTELVELLQSGSQPKPAVQKPSNTIDKAAAFELSQSVKDTNQSVNVEGGIVDESTEATCRLILRKRRSKERGDSSPCDSSSNEDITGQFRVSTGVKGKGRPKIRRKQAREAKKLRMGESIAEAKALVQGTFNVEDAVPGRHSITKVDAPTWKATSIVQLARKQKVHKKVIIFFQRTTDHEAGRMGVPIKKLGTFTEKDLITMRDWHDESPKFDAFSDLAAWIRVSRFARITLPSPLNNCVTVDLQACAKRLETVNLKTIMDTRFGQVGIEEMAFFRQSEWLDDSCMKHVMSHLMDQDQDEQERSCIGGVNPLYARVHDKTMKLQVIASSPLRSSSRMILVPVYLDGH